MDDKIEKVSIVISKGGLDGVYPLEAGMTDAQLEDFVFTGCRLIVAFMREAEERFAAGTLRELTVEEALAVQAGKGY